MEDPSSDSVKFSPIRIPLQGDVTVSVDVYKTSDSRFYIPINLRHCRPGEAWSGAPTVSLNPSELRWFLADDTPNEGCMGRIQSVKDKKDGVILSRLDDWGSKSGSGTKAKSRKITITSTVYGSMKANMKVLNDAVAKAEAYVEDRRMQQYRNDKDILFDLLVAVGVRMSNQLKQQMCAGCLSGVDASNQDAHVCMTEQIALCERALSAITVDHLASVLASNGLGRPTITIEEIIGDRRDHVLERVTQQCVSQTAQAYLAKHTAVQQMLFQTNPQPSTWNSVAQYHI